MSAVLSVLWLCCDRWGMYALNIIARRRRRRQQENRCDISLLSLQWAKPYTDNGMRAARSRAGRKDRETHTTYRCDVAAQARARALASA